MVENETWLGVATGNKSFQLLARADLIRSTLGQALSSKFSQLASFHRSVIGDPVVGSFELGEHGAHYFIHGDCRCRAVIVSAFIKEFAEKRRNDLFLEPIVVNLPRARAVKKSHASRARPQSKMHGQTITANHASMVLHIGKMLEE